MIAEQNGTTESCSWSIEVSSAEIDAGADFTLGCQVALPEKLNGNGIFVSIRDGNNTELTSVELTEVNENIFGIDRIVLTAPLDLGEQVWQAVLFCEDGVIPFDGAAAEFRFKVKAHTIISNAWDVPGAINSGERFTFHAGLKCSAECELAGRELELFDQDGARIGSGMLNDTVWSGTSALYFAEIEATAPLQPGDYEWELRFLPFSDSGLAHSGCELALPIRVMAAPDHEVVITVVDAEQQSPIAGARIVMHPYRAITDENGMAKIKVVKGPYRLLVSATRYLSDSQSVEVSDDMTVNAKLALEPVIDPASYYV